MLKKFASYYKPHKKLFILDMVSAFLIAVIDLIFPMVTREFTRDIIPNGKMRELYIITGALVVLFIIRAILNYIVDYWGHVVGARMEANMRKDLFSHIQTLPFSYFDKVKTGNLMSRIVNDLREISELAHHGPEDLFLSIIMLIGSFILMFTINIPLTLIVFTFIPVMLFFAFKKRNKMNHAFRTVKKKIANVNSQLQDSLSGIRVAKSFANEEYEMYKFEIGNREFKDSREFAFKSMAEFFTGMNFLINMLNLVVISVGGIFITNDTMNFSDLLAFLLFINFFMQPIRRLTQFTQQFQDGMTGFERFLQILEVKPDIVDEAETVLKGIDLDIAHGKTFALVGPSGGGKSTLCNLIPRFYEVDEGSVTIDDIDIKKIKIKSLRENIGFVQQDVFLFTGTIEENILYGRSDATHEEVIDAAKNSNIHDFIMTLPNGYKTYIGEKGVRLSGGQKQRISIARVFLKNPPILILDEATSALDNETEIKIQKALEKLSKGRTTIVIAHRLSTIKNADKIVVLTDKGIEEKGTHEELLKNEKLYSKLYKSQFKGYMPEEVA
ncbi:ABC transporter ATP-binding protein [Senegalia sp. (in: firmicutes)]|uniref:ABC transporter ATP-binding protein n=3 Tax=Senegalia sp. (in: firmicutes) TaxID=1924098 RepID=UPI003F97D69D